MFRRAFQILILILAPLILMGASGEDLSFELDQYNTVFKSLDFHPDNFANLVSTYNDSQDFKTKYENNGNKITPELTLFLQNQQKLSNYLKIMRTFDNCAMNSAQGSDFLSRIRQASTFVDSSEVCGEDTRLEKLANHVSVAVREVMKENLRNSIAQQSLENGFLTYLDLQKRYKEPNISVGALALRYCGRKTCTSDESKKLIAAGKKYLQENLPNQIKIRDSAVSAVNTLNDIVAHPEMYQGKRLKGTELLIYTETVQDAIRRKQSIVFADVDRATDEITDSVTKQRLLIASDKSDENIDRSLKNLIKTNPAAVGQILMKNPGYTGAICKLTQELEDDIASAATRKKVFLWGGVVVGGVLAVTGVFSWAGAGILTAVSAETLTTIAAVSSVASLSIGVAESTYIASDALDKRDEVHRLHSGLRSGNNDEQTQDDYDAAVKEYIGLKKDAVLTLGFSMLDLGTITAIARAGKLKEVNSVLKELTTNSKLSLKIQDFSKRLTPGEMANMVKYLAGLPKAESIKIIEKMKNWNFSQFVKWLRALPGTTYNGGKNFIKDVKEADGLRKKIEILATTSRKSSDHVLGKAEDLVLNPYASLTNSNRKVRLPISLAAYTAFVQNPLDNYISSATEKKNKRIEDFSAEIIGYEQASQFYMQDESGQLQKDIIKHNSDIINWAKDKTGKMVLPRIKEFEKIGTINSEQATKLNSLTKSIYVNASLEIQRLKENEVIDFAKAIASDEWAQYEKLPLKDKVNAARKIARISLAQNYPSLLMNALEEDPAFSNLSANDKDLLSTALWPLKKMSSSSDVQLEYVLQHPEKMSSSTDREAIKIVNEQLSNGNSSLPESLYLVDAVQNNDTTWKQKQKQDSSFLPQNKKYLAQRPDLKDVANIIRLPSKSNAKPSSYTNELEFWHDIIKNPLYSDIHMLWSDGMINDRETINAVQNRNQSLLIVETLSTEVQKRDLKDDEITFLFGQNYSSSKNETLDALPIFFEAERITDLSNQKYHWTPEQEKNCKNTAAKIWMRYILTDKNEKIKGNLNTEKLNKSAKAQLTQAMESCSR